MIRDRCGYVPDMADPTGSSSNEQQDRSAAEPSDDADSRGWSGPAPADETPAVVTENQAEDEGGQERRNVSGDDE